jgi:hypothetical protein
MLARRFALLAATALFCSASTAHALTLRTPFVFVNNGQTIRVYVTNLGTKPITDLAVTLTKSDGTVDPPDTNICAENGPLLPGNTCLVIYVVNHTGFATVTGKGKFSAAAQVLGSGALVALVPATK